MSRNSISMDGLRLLNRRRFLRESVSGLSGIALASLLASSDLLAAEGPDAKLPSPIRPVILPNKPLAARSPHFAPKAKRVVMVFCSGALSHLDTWDYKPELIKRHGQPMPGSSALITFQGENGNLSQSPWPFKPRGQSGKYISDLLPNLANLADDMCFIHSMTGRTNTNGPGANFMR